MSWRDGASKVPQHQYDVAIVDHYAPKIQAALAAAFPESRLRAAVEQVASQVVKAPAGDVALLRSAALAALGATSGGGDLEQTLRQVFADAYGAAGHAAATQLGNGGATVTLQGVGDVDWGTWKPGDPAAAALLQDGGLRTLLDQAGVTVRGVDDTLLTQLSNTIGDGVAAGASVESVTRNLVGIVGDPARAERIAHTETARAMTVATMNTYQANGVAQWDWILSDEACPECEEQGDRNPHDLTDTDRPPLHPFCRCAVSPVASSASGAGPGAGGGGALGDALMQAGLDELGGLGADAAAETTADVGGLAADASEATASAAPAGGETSGALRALAPDTKWSAEKRQAILDGLRASGDQGKVLADTLERFQDGGSIARLRGNIEKYLNGGTLNATSRARAEAIVSALRDAPTDWAPDTLYRGMSVKGTVESILQKYEVGSDVDLNLTSFSSDRAVAVRFQSMTQAKGTTRVMVELVGPDKKLLPIQNLPADRRLFKEKEWVGGGKYRVVDAKKAPGGGVLIRMTQVGAL